MRSKKHEDGQVDWDIFITPQAFERLLDDYATNEQHEWNPRTNQYYADVAWEMKKDEAENPDLPDTREEWNATQVAFHEKLFPFSENLTTSMFIAAGELSEAQRERLASSLSLQRNDVAAIVLFAERAQQRIFLSVQWRILVSEQADTSILSPDVAACTEHS